MTDQFLNLLVLCFIGSVAGIIGGVFFLVNKKLARVFATYGIPLAAGVLLANSILDLLPHAVEEIGTGAFTVVLVVYVVFFVVEHFLFALHHHEEKDHNHVHTAIPLVILGDTIHNFLDGVAIATAFLINPALGTVVALSTFLHETPHEIADFGILLSAGWKPKKVFLVNLVSALATFPGAFLALYANAQAEYFSGVLLAAAAGLFLYVATTDFLPEVGKSKKQFSFSKFLVFILGVLIIVVIGYLLPHVEHEEGGDEHASYYLLNNDVSLLQDAQRLSQGEKYTI